MTKHPKIRKELLVLVWASMSVSILHAQTQEADTRAAIIGYASNIEAYPFYRCRFKTLFFESTTAAEARVGPGKKLDSVDAISIADSGHELLELFGDPNPKIESKTAVRGKDGVRYVTGKGYLNEKYLRDGKSSLGYTPGINSILLGRSDDGFPEASSDSITSPLHTWFGDRAVRSPDRLLIRPDIYTTTFLGKKEIEKKTLIGVRFDDPKHGLGYETYFDPERGYLPVVQYEYSDGKLSATCLILDARKNTPDRWFPTRLVSFGQERTATLKFSSRLVEVTELDVENRPKPEDLSSVFPANTNIHRMNGDNSFFKLKQDERLSTRDLDELFDKLEKSKITSRMDTAIEGKGRKFPVWIWVFGGLGFVLVLSGAILWLRRRARETRGVSA